MKTIAIYGLTAILLIGLTASVSAQDAEAQRQARDVQRAMMSSPMMQRTLEHSMRQSMLSNWENRTGPAAFGILHTDGNAEALGLSEEQRQTILDSFSKVTISNADPDLKPFLDQMMQLNFETPGGPFAENASEEVQVKYATLQMKMNEVLQKRRNDLINETLSPEQFRKIQEYQIATMATNPFVSPDMFEALDLSDDQKKQLEEIKRELKPEYEKSVDKWAASQAFHQIKFMEEIGDRLDNVTDPEERRRISSEASQKVTEHYPENSIGMREFTESGIALSNRLKIEMFDVLTDEQWNRMLGLIDNPPDHVKKIFENFRNMAIRMNAPQAANAPDPWQPGPGSWQPGDGIPAGYRIERETRSRQFPRGE